MKFMWLGYLDVESWSKKTPAEQNAAIDACFAYDDVLRKAGDTVWKRYGIGLAR